MGAIAFATLWPVIAVLRALAWIGKGLRSPARNALLAESVPAADRGKAFGFHRSGDTIGAILGPLVAAWLIGSMGEVAVRQVAIFQNILLWTLVPGIGAALVMGLVVREIIRGATKSRRLLGASLSELPRSYSKFLVAVGIFGAGDFSHTLLILGATQLLAPDYGFIKAAQWGAILFAIRNAAAALAAFPVGWLSDRIGRQSLLTAGYFVGVLTAACLALMFATNYADVVLLAALFIAAGVVNAIQESLEGALTTDLFPTSTCVALRMACSARSTESGSCGERHRWPALDSSACSGIGVCRYDDGRWHIRSCICLRLGLNVEKAE